MRWAMLGAAAAALALLARPAWRAVVAMAATDHTGHP
jgi:hypothetical protein